MYFLFFKIPRSKIKKRDLKKKINIDKEKSMNLFRTKKDRSPDYLLVNFSHRFNDNYS